MRLPCRGFPRRALPLLSGVLVAALFAGAPDVARAEVRCVEASRYATLTRLTGGDLRRLVTGLGLKDRAPPPDACRAVLMTGVIDAANLDALLRTIAASRGWLAALYLAAGDGDLDAEIKLADAVRAFRLSVILMRTDLTYTLDFLPPRPSFPVSVSYGWAQKEAETTTPLQDRTSDYYAGAERRIERGGSHCQRGCRTILAGAVDRFEIAAGQSGDPPEASVPQSREQEEARSAARRRLGLPDGRGLPRLPDAVAGAVKRACRARIDFAGSVASAIAADVDRYAGKDFPFMRMSAFMRKARELEKAGDAADLCLIQVLDRERLAAFTRRCKDRCDAGTLDAGPEAATGQ